MTKYNVSPLVAREIEFSTGTIFGGSWCRYFISITLHQCYIEATNGEPPYPVIEINRKGLAHFMNDDQGYEKGISHSTFWKLSRRIRSLGQVSRGNPMENLSLTCKHNASLLAHRELPIILYSISTGIHIHNR